MISEAQLLANRANGQKSRGPITAEGKAIASRNSITHGLLSKTDILLSDENEDDLQAFTDALRADLQPEGAVEELLFSRLVSCGWRLKRAARIEASVLTWYTADERNRRAMERSYACFLNLKPLSRPLGRLINPEGLKEHTSEEISSRLERDAPTTVLGRAFVRDVGEADAMTKLSRYERGLERSFLRSLWWLEEAKRGRRKLSDIPVEAR